MSVASLEPNYGAKYKLQLLLWKALIIDVHIVTVRLKEAILPPEKRGKKKKKKARRSKRKY